MDYMKGWHFADMAAALEDAVVFPGYYIGNVENCSFAPGTITIPTKLMLDMLKTICSEIARNGFKKILIVNAHGGNTRVLDLFLDMLTEEKCDYVVYTCPPHFGERTLAAKQQMMEETGCENGHAGGYETAVALHLFPELVKMDEILPREAGKMKRRGEELGNKNLRTSMHWYMKYPLHLAGYGGDVSSRHGKLICEAIAEDIADLIRTVKQDDFSLKLQEKFYMESGKA
jgi:creatinine amidohydrolase